MPRYNIVYDLQHAFVELFNNVMLFLPQLLLAILILIVGWIVGGFIGGLIRRLFVQFHLDDALDKAGVDELSRRAGYSFSPATFAGDLVKWFIIIVFLIVALDILNLSEVTTFMRTAVLSYLPQVFAAVLILFAGVIVAGITKTAVTALVESSKLDKNPALFGRIAYYLVLVFTGMAVLNQLQIAADLIKILFMGIVFALSLATGLAFGLGGRDTAARYLDTVTGRHTHHS